MKNHALAAQLQSAQSYLSEALEVLESLNETLQELHDEGRDSDFASGTLSQTERAQTLTASALSALDRVRLK
ncbi:hypothetical protein IJT93_03280 [bacterium]|nr:hypothetical protein [bacterium]